LCSEDVLCLFVGTKRKKIAYITYMRTLQQHLVLIGLSVAAVLSSRSLHGQTLELDDALLAVLTSRQYNMEGDGRDFLLSEAKNNQFFLLGELQGTVKFPRFSRVSGLNCGSKATGT